jgi:predicted DNA-binding transcriptional regulator YafY
LTISSVKHALASLEDPIDRLKKTDRLIKLWLLIQKNPRRYGTRELAEKFNVNVKTIYRDIESLGLELGVPVYPDKTKWVINESHFLPPIRFSKSEALNIFMAARLMLNFNQRYDPNMDLTFSTLAAILPDPLKEQVQNTLNWLQQLPRDEKYIGLMAKLAEAWATQHCVKMSYRAYNQEKPVERTVRPYFVEPIASGHAGYLIGYCCDNNEVRTYKIDRIESLNLTPETYTIPSDFDGNAFLGSAWGIIVGGQVQTYKLKFHPDIARIIKETRWHPSQLIQEQKDGSIVMTLKVSESIEFTRWVLGWGLYVDVLSPVSLRREIAQNAKVMLDKYNKK